MKFAQLQNLIVAKNLVAKIELKISLPNIVFIIAKDFNEVQGWIKCGSGEHRSQEMTRKIEEIVTLGYEEKKEEGGRRKRRGRKRRNKKRRGRKRRGERKRGEKKKEEVEIEKLTEEEEEHGDDKSSKANE